MLEIESLLYENKMSKYELSKKSGVPYSCICDICSLKTNINNITIGNAIKIANALNIKIEDILFLQNKYNFESFRSDIQHEIKRKGQLIFLLEVLQSSRIQDMFRCGLKTESLYLLASIDYISRINNIPLAKNLSKYRQYRCASVIYPTDLLFANQDEKINALNRSIEEFKNFNIVEVDFLNVA